MKLSRCPSILFLAALCGFATGISAAQDKPPRQGDDGDRLRYESWIRDYRVGPLRGALGFQQHDIKLVVTVVEGDDLEPNAKSAAIFGPYYRIVFHGCAVAIDGTVSS